jgi:hypothetical protein
MAEELPGGGTMGGYGLGAKGGFMVSRNRHASGLDEKGSSHRR